MDNILSFEDVCFYYGAQETLHNVTFAVPHGSLVAIVGPNGGGKSTLVQLGLGLLKPRLGKVRLFGDAPEKTRHRVGYVPQHLSFDKQFPVRALDVVLMGRVDRKIFGPYNRADKDAAQQALDRVDLADQADKLFAELSGGQRQRVLIAQALITEPDLLMLDEPMASVDLHTEQHIYELLNEMNQQVTIVLVSHNLNMVTNFATHVGCVNRTVSLIPRESMTSDQLHAAMEANMAILHHADSCHVLNPAAALEAPHRGRREAP